MKEFIGKYQKAIVGTGAVSVLLICFLQQKELSKLREENRNLGHHIVEQHGVNVDSLNNEIFILKNEIGRWELSLDHLREVQPKSADEFETFLHTQTE